MRGFFSLHLDSLGFSISFLCAIHCALLPIALTFSAFSGIAFLDNPAFETTIILLSLAVALASLLWCYFRHHHRLAPALWAASGFAIILAGKALPGELETLLTPAGACVIALAHYINWRICRKKNCSL